MYFFLGIFNASLKVFYPITMAIEKNTYLAIIIKHTILKIEKLKV
jgi:hypothetical protein